MPTGIYGDGLYCFPIYDVHGRRITEFLSHEELDEHFPNLNGVQLLKCYSWCGNQFGFLDERTLKVQEHILTRMGAKE